MIPILYTHEETQFVTNGLGRLSDIISCTVTEERNGVYECEFEYPLDGVHYDEIQLGRIVAVTHDENHDIQPFEIYARTVPDLRGVVTFNAHHISYRLADVVIMPFTAESAAGALSAMESHSANTSIFTYWTDKVVSATFNNTVPRSARGMLGGEENSILDVYGTGEYEFDKFDVKLYLHRGTDSGVAIRYGKNLVDLNQKKDTTGSYNAIVPFWADSEGNIVTLPEQLIVYSGSERQTAYLTDHNQLIIRTETNDPIEVDYTVIDAAPMDLSDAFEEKPTVEQLRAKAQARFERSQAWLPNENLTVDFVQLWQTEEYKEYAALQRVKLCDTVSVYYPQAGIEAVEQKVVKVVYNVLLDRYDSIELGSVQTSLGEAIKADVLVDVPTNSMMDSAIKYATDLIRGGLGGYVVMTPGPDGYPQEILIMDTPNVNTAVNVWRFNQGGLGHSSHGYQGPYSDIALTQDGKINASMITTGTLNANLIRAGRIQDTSGLNYWDLTSGRFATQRGTIGPFTVTADQLRFRTEDSQSVIRNAISFRRRNSFQDDPNTYYMFGTELTGGSIYFYLNDDGDFTTTTRKARIALIKDSSTDSYGVGIVNTDATNNVAQFYESGPNWPISLRRSTLVTGDFSVSGTKNRTVKTDNYSDRLLYSYETPTPMFGDIGEAVIGDDGLAYVDIDDIFSETIADKVEYQVFLQKEGEGDCYVAEKTPRYFVVSGTPNMKVAWELKAKQRGYELKRLESLESKLDEYEYNTATMEDYITEQEALLYG